MDSNVFCTIESVPLGICDDVKRGVPIFQICQALGIDYTEQVVILRKSSLFSPAMYTENVCGVDGCGRWLQQTVCLPIDYVLGWIVSINLTNSTRSNAEFLRELCYKAFADLLKDSPKGGSSTFEKEIALLNEQVQALKSIDYHEGAIEKLKSRVEEIDDEIFKVRKKRNEVIEVPTD